MKKLNYIHLFLMVLGVALFTSLFTGCVVTGSDRYDKSTKGPRATEDQVRFDGKITQNKNGAYRIRSTSGKLYRPVNLPNDFKRQGLRVVVFGEKIGSSNKRAQPLEIYEIGVRR